jgi:hypothetical protein
MVLESQPVDVRDTVEASIDQVAADAVLKGLHMAYALDPRLAVGRVMGDGIRIRQVHGLTLSWRADFLTDLLGF